MYTIINTIKTKNTGNNNFQTLDKRQYRTGIPKKRNTNKIGPAIPRLPARRQFSDCSAGRKNPNKAQVAYSFEET